MGFCEGPVSPGPGPVDSYTPPPNRPAPGDLVSRMFKYEAVPSFPMLRKTTTVTLPTRSRPRRLTAPPQRTGARARCQYGTQRLTVGNYLFLLFISCLRYYDERTRCEECYCNEPCHGFQCPQGTTCQVPKLPDSRNIASLLKVEPYSPRGETVYKAVCKDDTKNGICPKVGQTRTPRKYCCDVCRFQVNRNQYANCDAECESDGGCSGEQKCCYNGCGQSCMKVDCGILQNHHTPFSQGHYSRRAGL